MAQAYEVLEMLIPTGGWVIYGDDFESIIYDQGVTPLTKKQFEEGFAKVDAWKISEMNRKKEEKLALYARLGITEDEAKFLFG